MALYILLIAVGVIVGVIVSRTSAYNKRGCGRGCPTCRNRFICHPGEYPEEEKEA